MKKKVVLVNQSTGYLMIDIVNAYAAQYDEITLIAGSIKTMERHLNKSVRVKKIMAYNRTSSLKRLFTWSWASVQIFFLLLFRYRQYEIVYVTNPPMAYLSALLLKNIFSIIVYDTYPDALKNVGIKNNNIVYYWWNLWNKKLFKRASKIITLSNSMANKLSQYVEKEKIRVVENWAGSEKFAPIEKKMNFFLVEQQLVNKFIIMYSGNIGYTHSIETLIEAAIRLKNKNKIHFLIIGEGKKKDELIRMVKLHNLENCTFLTWQTKEILPYSLAAADLAVVSINEETALLSIPSKTYNLLAVGAPLLCITPANSELAVLISKYENGAYFTKNQVNEIVNYILMLSENPKARNLLSDNSLTAAQNYSYSNAQNYL